MYKIKRFLTVEVNKRRYLKKPNETSGERIIGLFDDFNFEENKEPFHKIKQ